jgi:glycosyltransferase involved in cell wall biosynthesis
MASGMGIVINENVLGVGKLIVNGVNGFVCGNNDDEYIYSIECYLKNFRLVNEHGELNKMKVRDFSIESTAKLYFNQLSKLL